MRSGRERDGTAAATSGASSIVATNTAVTVTTTANVASGSGATTSMALTTQPSGTSGAVVRAGVGLMIVTLGGLMFML